MLKKKIIYHFFIPKDYETNIAVKLHRECLKMYCSVFDSAIFYIAYDPETEKYVPELKEFLFNLKDWEDIRINVVENDVYCEAKTFKAEVYDKRAEFNEELVFFGHTKGVINVSTYKYNVENILKWAFGGYFYSLEHVDDAVKELLYGYRTFYGSFLMENKELENAMYAGTFYWVNPLRIDTTKQIGKIPEKLSGRTFAEDFPSYFYFKDGDGYLYSWNNAYLFETDFYNCEFDRVISFLGDYEQFMEKYNEIRSRI